MSVIYDEYLEEHRYNVYKAFEWLRDNYILKNIRDSENLINDIEYLVKFNHDRSKNDIEEYDAYDKYFNSSRSYEVVNDFNYAWNHHLHHNPHHWQYWVLINDDKDSGEKCLEIPDKYLFEMICDWWSFSLKNGNPLEILDWYEKGKDYRKIHPDSLKKIEDVLDFIKKNF